jgi:CRP/FNR family cyclic AMP-dependent transcriptional regulator
MLSRVVDGAAAPMHATVGPPEEWIIRRDDTGAANSEGPISDLPGNVLRGLFSGLSRKELVYLSERMSIRSFPKNSVILSENEPTHALYVIANGNVKITKVDLEGNEVIIAILSRGDYFGEAGLIQDEVWPGTVTAKDKCQVFVFKRDDLHSVLMRNSQFAMNVLKGLIKRLGQAYCKIASLALNDVYGRIVQLLVDLASESPEGIHIIDEPMTQQEIANMIGSSREMVSRIMRELVKGGYISIKNKRTTILK